MICYQKLITVSGQKLLSKVAYCALSNFYVKAFFFPDSCGKLGRKMPKKA